MVLIMVAVILAMSVRRILAEIVKIQEMAFDVLRLNIRELANNSYNKIRSSILLEIEGK